MSVVVFTVGVALAIACAAVLARALGRGGDRLWRVFSVVALFSVVATVASLVAGLGHALHANGLMALLAIFFLIGGGCVAWRVRQAAPQPVTPEPASGHSGWLERATLAVALVACLVPASLNAAELLFGACRFQFDDYSYHGPMIGHWLQRNMLYLAPAKFQAYYAGGGELISAFFIELGGGDAFASAASLYWLLLGVLSFPVAGAALGASRGGMLVAAGLLLCSPIVSENLGTIAVVDFAGAAAVLATIAAALRTMTKPAGERTHCDVLMVGLIAGVAVGTKVTMFVMVGPLVLAACIASAQRKGARLVTLALVALAGALLTGGYWYIRNFIVTGNPVFPAEVPFFDGPLDTAFQRSTSLYQHVLEEKWPDKLARIWSELFGWPVALSWVAGIGLAYGLVVAPFVVKGSGRWLVPLVAAAASACFWVVFSGPFSGSVNAFEALTRVGTRMFLPVIAVLLLLAGAAVRRPQAERWHWAPALATLAGAVLVAVLVIGRTNVLYSTVISIGVVAAGFALAAVHARAAFIARVPRVASWAALAVLVCGSLAGLAATLRALQPEYDGDARGWLSGVLDDVPPGSVIATPNVFGYYALFGKSFELDPFRIDEDSQPYPMLHIEWQQDPTFSWGYEFGAKWKSELKAIYELMHPPKGWRAIEDKDERKAARDRTIIDGLRASGADYVLIASYNRASIMHGAKPKERAQPFPPLVNLLDESPHFDRIKTRKSAILFEIKQP